MTLSLVFQEYADNVLGTGIHGALLFLERGTFTSQQLASALKISSSKTQLRKKLTSKLIQLFSEEAVNRYDTHHYPECIKLKLRGFQEVPMLVSNQPLLHNKGS